MSSEPNDPHSEGILSHHVEQNPFIEETETKQDSKVH